MFSGASFDPQAGQVLQPGIMGAGGAGGQYTTAGGDIHHKESVALCWSFVEVRRWAGGWCGDGAERSALKDDLRGIRLLLAPTLCHPGRA